MNVVFCVPPPKQRIGGLDAAIQGLRAALTHLGLHITDLGLHATDLGFRSTGGTPSEASGHGTIFHFHGLWQPAHARLARECVARRVPYVVSPHGMLEPWAWRHKWWKKWPYFHAVEKGYLARAHALLATAPPEARRLQKFFPRQQVETLPLGLTSAARPDYLAARHRLGWPADERVLLYLSRIHVKKGLNLLLEALSDLKVPGKTRLVIVGNGDPTYVHALQAFARERTARLPSVEWIGAVWGEERWPYFQGADLFCLPTHSENFGLAVLEACQVGTPVLTTTGTPWAEHLSRDRGFIAQPTVASVREQLHSYFAQPPWSVDPRRSLADWAHAHFAWAHLAPRYAAFYERQWR